ncbi:uncharacterized protein ARMOST_06418 [Armillaria ostoyae]|uniref:Uncharacterized protein n=1 Tax=Armillaria ostoyae TaxID=47428 RepID=A0A284R2Y3_ARMOS|nr:uncharacterized protein ARMOST_06418 [Armillaria ostoyae]
MLGLAFPSRLRTFTITSVAMGKNERSRPSHDLIGVYAGEGVETVVVRARSLHARNSAWEMGGYRFVIGVHPHKAKSYTPPTKSEILSRIHLVLDLQLWIAVDRGIPITVHTREAEENTDRITNEIISAFTSLSFSLCLLEYFPNLHIG